MIILKCMKLWPAKFVKSVFLTPNLSSLLMSKDKCGLAAH